MVHLLIAFILVIIAGIFDAAQTSKKDLDLASPLFRLMKSDKLKDWYIGGNTRYNPSFPSLPFFNYYQADFFHTMKFGWIYSYAAAIATLSAPLFSMPVLAWIIIFIIAQGLEGETFRIFYGNIFRNDPKDSIWQILSDFNPFKNTHTKD
jgi:hypothetical protein